MATPEIDSSYDTRTLIFRSLMVVSYVCFGGGIFHVLERDEARRESAMFEEHYNKTMSKVLSCCLLNDTEMQVIMAEIRRTFLQDTFPKEWGFLGGIHISVQAITTIGYGDTVPKTVAGRMFLIIYATVGIPLMAMMLTTFGDKLKYTIRSSIISFERRILKRNLPQNIQRKSLIAVFLLTAVVLCSISGISAKVENWDFSLALYVWFVTFSTIGFGDYVPQGTRDTNALYMGLEIAYALGAFLLGLTLIATILHTLSDWVNSKQTPTKNDLKRSLGRMANSLSTHKEETSANISETLGDVSLGDVCRTETTGCRNDQATI